jgi:hypothetical protein
MAGKTSGGKSKRPDQAAARRIHLRGKRRKYGHPAVSYKPPAPKKPPSTSPLFPGVNLDKPLPPGQRSTFMVFSPEMGVPGGAVSRSQYEVGESIRFAPQLVKGYERALQSLTAKKRSSRAAAVLRSSRSPVAVVGQEQELAVGLRPRRRSDRQSPTRVRP